MKKHLLNFLLWSVVAAAFIGPGTVTTAAAAGTKYQTSLLWALSFSVFACIILQEAVARLHLVTGLSLGEALKARYPHRTWLAYTAGGMVVFGCIAYQAGNILGAVKGISLATQISPKVITATIVTLCFVLLITSSYKVIARLLGLVVACMGVFFFSIALQSDYTLPEIALSAFTPTIPEGSTTLIIGLIGTTIVPYNLFLASDLAKGQSVSEMRASLSFSILLGGFISAAVLIAGTLLVGEFSFEALGEMIASKMGKWGFLFFGFGLFAAGFTSSVTAPLASALTAASLIKDENKKKLVYRIAWIVVLFLGGTFGMLDIKPIPAIILAQAINGLLLPFVSLFLFFAVNDQKLMPKENQNPLVSNIFMLIVIGVTSYLGFNHLVSAAGKMGITVPDVQAASRMITLSVAALLLVIWAAIGVYKNRI